MIPPGRQPYQPFRIDIPVIASGDRTGPVAGQYIPVGQEFVDNPQFPEYQVKKGIEPEQTAYDRQCQDIQRMPLPDMIQLMAENGLPLFRIKRQFLIPEKPVQERKRSTRLLRLKQADAFQPDTI